MDLLPIDVPVIKEVYPMEIVADRNCFPRVLSVLAFGSDEYHLDSRLHLAKELIEHKHDYLDEDYLSKGLVERILSPAMVAQMSVGYVGAKSEDAGKCRSHLHKGDSSSLTTRLIYGCVATVRCRKCPSNATNHSLTTKRESKHQKRSQQDYYAQGLQIKYSWPDYVDVNEIGYE